MDSTKAPFVPIAIAFILGILMQYYLTASITIWLILACSGFAYKQPIRLFYLSIIMLGFLVATLQTIEVVVPKGARIQSVAKIESMPEKGTKRWQRVDARLICFADSSQLWRPTNEKIQLYVDTSLTIHYGQTITYTTRHYAIDSSYGKYVGRQGVTARQYAYAIDSLDQTESISSKIAELRSLIAVKIRQIDAPTSAVGLIEALTIGLRVNLDKEQRSDYQRVGVAHLLAVSGLHVGIVYGILNLILGWVKVFRRGYLVVGLIVIVLLLGYAFLTGFSASVVRAVLMFTLFQIGNMTSRGYSSLNILCSTAFFLLIFKASWIFDLGFQLSFLAMVGITIFFQPLRCLWRPRFKVMEWLWTLTALSMSAQVAVMPLVAFKFGQLPLVALLINPIVWFTVPVIIGFSIFYIISNWSIIGQAATSIAELQNNIISWASSHSWVALEVNQMPIWICYLSYAILLILAYSVVNHPIHSMRHKSR